jgi:DnaJ-class molecular chaperone
MEILGLRVPIHKSDAMATYRRLVTEHHPDRGGDPRMLKWITAAWDYLKDMKGWK